MKRRSTIKLLFASLGLLLVLCMSLIIFAINKYNGIKADPLKVLTKNEEAQTPQAPQTSVQDAFESTKPVLKQIVIDDKKYTPKAGMVNMLFCGVDYMSSRASRNLGERSDMIMVCAIDANTHKATLISIPRDTRAQVNKVDINTGKITDTEYNKINAAFSYGGGSDHYSYQNTLRAVEKFISMGGKFNIPINYYTSLNVDGIPHIADAIGGVTVTLQEDFPGIGSKGKTVTLTGQKATDFVRERDEFASQDLARVQHQQQFMVAMAKKIQKMGAANSVVKLYDKVTQYIHTNLNTDQMVALALILDKMNIDSIEHVTIPGTWKKPYIWPDTSSLEDLILKTFYDSAE